MYFVEFLEPRPGVPVERFETIVRDYAESWAAEHPEDELVCTIGRSWWLGPEPGYITIWRIGDVSTFERWQRELAGAEMSERAREFDAACRIVQAGLFEDLGTPR